MRILNRNVYVGPSQYAKFPVIRLELDLGALEQWPTAKLGGGFIDALVVALPGLAEHEPVCLLGLTVHFLIAGSTFNLHTRKASAGTLANG